MFETEPLAPNAEGAAERDQVLGRLDRSGAAR